MTPQNSSTTEVTEALRGYWEEVLEVDSIADEDNFFSLGGDSLSAVELMEKVESGLEIEFPLDVLLTNGDFSALVAACLDRVSASAEA